MAPDGLLTYKIHSSEHGNQSFAPENVLCNDPANPESRWSASKPGGASWILVELEKACIVNGITFGKHCKPHPCNIKDIKVFAGPEIDDLSEVLHTNLKNDTTPEYFDFHPESHPSGSALCRFVKIAPVSTHAIGFRASIWHLQLHGIDDEDSCKRAMDNNEQRQEDMTNRLILKHFRRKGCIEAYSSFLRQINMRVEHPLISHLYTTLVSQGDFTQLDSLLSALYANGLFDDYLHHSPKIVVWTLLTGLKTMELAPHARVGHDICIDLAEGIIYLYGGWDGRSQLGDFWAYYIREGEWKLLFDGNPADAIVSPRCGHQLVYDGMEGHLYMLGRVPFNGADVGRGLEGERDVEFSGTQDPASEFVRQHLRGPMKGTKEYLSLDTYAQGGPPLLWNHQMVIDEDRRQVYVYGGNMMCGDDIICNPYLYRYNIMSDEWSCLKQEQDSDSSKPLTARQGHGMVLDTSRGPSLISLGGQGVLGTTDVQVGTEMILYDTRSKTTELLRDVPYSISPTACMDPGEGEIYLMQRSVTGVRISPNDPEHIKPRPPPLYVYDDQSRAWSKAIPVENTHGMKEPVVPSGVNSHVAVYDPKRKAIYAIGTSVPGLKTGKPTVVWRGVIDRQSHRTLIRKLKFKARCQQFREMCEDGFSSLKALSFLKEQVAAIADFEDQEENQLVRDSVVQLLARPLLFETDTVSVSPVSEVAPGYVKSKKELNGTAHHDNSEVRHSQAQSRGLPAVFSNEDDSKRFTPIDPARFRQRTAVFDEILRYVNVEAKEPTENLVQLVGKGM